MATLLSETLPPLPLPTDGELGMNDDLRGIQHDWQQIEAGKLSPLDAGFVTDEISTFYTQSRVAGWDKDGIREADIVKFETMNPLTERGEKLVTALRNKKDISSKQADDWRIPTATRRLLRVTSIDELPQVLFNVMGMPTDAFPELRKKDLNLMDLKLVASARPRLASEVTIDGDNANDLFVGALGIMAARHGVTGRRRIRDMYEHYGPKLIPGVTSSTTADGGRQISTLETEVAWLEGFDHYDRIQKMSSICRARAISALLAKNAQQVLLRTNAV